MQRKPFAYSSLHADDRQEDSGAQMSLFETEEQLGNCTMVGNDQEVAPQLQRYAIVDIEQVWREEKENVG